MSDLLLDNQNARKLIKALGLPIPVPERLARAKGPYEERPLDDKRVLVCGTGALSAVLAEILTKAGANPWVVGESDAVLEPGGVAQAPAQNGAEVALAAGGADGAVDGTVEHDGG